MKILKSFLISVLFLPFLVFAQTNTVLPSAGLTPESPFYFIDRLGEALQEFFTFNPEAKAKLQITFAAERIAEIQVILETKGVEAKGLKVAQAKLQGNIAKAASIIEKEKNKGKDVKNLAKSISNDFEIKKDALKEIFRAQKHALQNQKEDLKEKIGEAKKEGNVEEINKLVIQLNKVKNEKKLLDKNKEEHEDALENEEEKIEKEMEGRDDAQKAIREAEKKRAEVLKDIEDEGIEIPKKEFDKFEGLLSQAKSLFEKENYQGSKQLAKQAKKSLEDVKDSEEGLKEAKEDKEDEGEKDKNKNEEKNENDDEDDDTTEVEKKEKENIREEAKDQAEVTREEIKKAAEIENESSNLHDEN